MCLKDQFWRDQEKVIIIFSQNEPFFIRIALVLNFTVTFLFLKLGTNENLLACAAEPNHRSHLIKKK